ncbi:MAG: HTH-type transcriptional regulator HexR [Paracidovorax wautersii]|uniref:HTH-type transcriptional regulator HexR n=1 Tax=Paracidovorax wautersii TaxID=1177982 RepID=A0A7V8FN45_9BURK|nr:MAG: HTH-type transcriptional regulator HexR [Paracidovorax wautersii]
MSSAFPATPAAFGTPEQFLHAVSAQYDTLSRQLKLIARHVEAQREHFGLQGIQEVAQACGVQPSAVVRFAKHFGFSGFSELQKLFREAIAQQVAPARNYQSRIRDVIDSGRPMDSHEIAREFLGGSIACMAQLRDTLEGESFGRAVDLLAAADTIWLAGVRRSFSVVAYLDYALQHTDKRIQLVSGLGGMQHGQLRSLRPGDVMLAVSFAPYGEETLDVIDGALQQGATLIALTDSRFNPLASRAHVALLLRESETFGFRALTSTMGLAQSLFIALAYRLELAYQPHQRRSQAQAEGSSPASPAPAAKRANRSRKSG